MILFEYFNYLPFHFRGVFMNLIEYRQQIRETVTFVSSRFFEFIV